MTLHKPILIVGIAIASLTVFVFAPTLQYGFVNWDDDLYVYENPHLNPPTAEGIWRLTSQPYYRSYTPVAFLSHALDVAVWRLNPFGHHLSNVVIHAANAALVFWLALLVLIVWRREAWQRLSLTDATSSMISGAVVTALLFALHPLRAESVAWISDRKDLVAGFLMLSATIYYVYAGGESRKHLPVLLAIFIMALGAKTTAVVLPLIWLGLDLFVMKRDFAKSLIGKIPFLALAIVVGLIARMAAPDLDREFIMGEKSVWEILGFPFTSVVFYLKNHLLPYNLSPVYHTERFFPDSPGLMIGAVVLVLALTAGAVMVYRKGRRSPLVAWLAFLLFLSPTFTGVMTGIQPVADRYTYLASISLCLLIGGGMERLLRGTETSLMARNIVLAGLFALFATFTYTTLQQIRVWRDPMSLWTFVVPRAPFPLAFKNLGKAQLERQMYSDAIISFNHMLEMQPGSGEAFHYKGVAFERSGLRDSAVFSFRKALGLQPRLVESRARIAAIFAAEGKPDSAMTEYNAALETDPSFLPALFGKGDLLMKSGAFLDASEVYTRALMADPFNPVGWFNLGVAYEQQGILTNAAECYKKAISLQSDYHDAYINLGNVYAKSDDPNGAIGVFGRALVLFPNSADAYYNLGYVLHSSGDSEKAAQAFESAIRSDSSYATAYFNLALIKKHQGERDASQALLNKAAQLGFEEARRLLREGDSPK